MKVGVVTYSSTIDNYGQVLQYLATQEFLKDFDFDVFLLREKVNNPLWKRLLRPLYYFIKNIILRKRLDSEFKQKRMKFKKWHSISDKMEKKHPRHFEEFRKKNFKIVEDDGSYFYNAKFDAFCAGSDQIWSESPFYYFLRFAPKECIRFSVASSVGHRPITNEFVNDVKEDLSLFSFITVREKNGVELCRKAGRCDAHLVLDPTFLISSDRYFRFSLPLRKKRPYIFLYLLGADISVSVEDIFSFAEEKNMDVKYVASQGRCDSFPKIYATVEEWLSLLVNADYVLTNSFHGMALSLIHHKNFLVFPVVGVLSTLNGRIENIASIFALTSRIYDKSMEILFDSIDWCGVDSVIEKNKQFMSSLMGTLVHKKCNLNLK
ncbi:MAG: polysaccharide pyruvyl transferase family protein [Fibrobacter sp.]|nr:polysaccharide pyruvyl transferase family protein [Fibrobacter sp.]